MHVYSHNYTAKQLFPTDVNDKVGPLLRDGLPRSCNIVKIKTIHAWNSGVTSLLLLEIYQDTFIQITPPTP